MTDTLFKKFNETCLKYPDDIAIQYKRSGRWYKYSFLELRKQTLLLAMYLIKAGFGKGDRVAIVLENRPEWPVIFFASMSIGLITVPINPELSDEEIGNILKDSLAKLLFVSANYQRQLPEDVVSKIISVDSENFISIIQKPVEDIEKFKSYFNQVECEDIASLMYTSGTTQTPKAVMLTHKNFLSNSYALYSLKIVSRRDRTISILPLYHTYSLTVTMILPLLYGGMIVYPESIRSEALIEALRITNPTIFVAVPRILYTFYHTLKEGLKRMPLPFCLILNAFLEFLYRIRMLTGINLTRYILIGLHHKFGKSLRFFVSGGAKLDGKVERFLFKLGFTILEGYGLTETSPVLTISPLKKPKIGSCGKPIPGVEIKLVNKDKSGIGEVVVRGPNIMKGYYKNDALNSSILKDGWFFTGDLGYIDKEGYLFLTGRIKDIIVLSSGLNVNPEELENVYNKFPPFKDVCIVDIPLKRENGEENVLWAVVIPDIEYFKKHGVANMRFCIKENLEAASKLLPSYKRIKGFSISFEDLPKTPLGKIKRFAVREKLLKEMSRAPALERIDMYSKEREVEKEDEILLDDFAGKCIMDVLKRRTRLDRISLSDSLELDLGIDSLGRVEFAEEVERQLGIKISDEAINLAFTVKELIIRIKTDIKNKRLSSLKKEASRVFIPEDEKNKWKKILSVLPKKENIDRINLKPGFVDWVLAFLFTFFMHLFFKLFFRLKVIDNTNYNDKKPTILYANHTSYFDGLLIACSLPRYPRLNLFFVGLRIYFDFPVIRNLIRTARIIPIDFATHLVEALRSTYYVLQNGKSVCIFPEGARSFDGNIRDFKKGFGVLTRESGARLLPISISGAFEAWPRSRAFPKPARIEVRFGRIIEVDKVEKIGFSLGANNSYEAVCTGARKILMDLKEKR